MTVAELIARLQELDPAALMVIQDVGGCCAYPLHSCDPVRYQEEGGPIGHVYDPAEGCEADCSICATREGEPAALLIPE